MKIIRNNIIPFKGYKAINICGILFVRKGAKLDEDDLRHETIHTKQILEMLVVFYYLWYVIEWFIRWIGCFDAHRAYRHIGFEREAYENENDSYYLDNRKHYCWIKLI